MSELLTPPPEREIPLERLRQHRDVLLAEVISTHRDSAQQRRPFKRAWVALVAAASLLAISATAYAVLQPSPEAVVEAVVCLNNGGDGDVVAADGRNPVDICRERWAQGSVGDTPAGALPELIACVDPPGHVVYVFPTEDQGTCHEVKMAPIPNRYEEAATAFAAMRDDLFARADWEGCVAPREAVATAEAVLADHEMSGWQVTESVRFASKPCSSYFLDAVDQTILLLAEPRHA
ncbi:MAG: hypothetical protein WD556_07740 [Actinomycetota bacterium]